MNKNSLITSANVLTTTLWRGGLLTDRMPTPLPFVISLTSACLLHPHPKHLVSNRSGFLTSSQSYLFRSSVVLSVLLSLMSFCAEFKIAVLVTVSDNMLSELFRHIDVSQLLQSNSGASAIVQKWVTVKVALAIGLVQLKVAFTNQLDPPNSINICFY